MIYEFGKKWNVLSRKRFGQVRIFTSGLKAGPRTLKRFWSSKQALGSSPGPKSTAPRIPILIWTGFVENYNLYWLDNPDWNRANIALNKRPETIMSIPRLCCRWLLYRTFEQKELQLKVYGGKVQWIKVIARSQKLGHFNNFNEIYLTFMQPNF